MERMKTKNNVKASKRKCRHAEMQILAELSAAWADRFLSDRVTFYSAKHLNTLSDTNPKLIW